MAVQAIVRHRLDLMLRLIDSVTGRSISGKFVQIHDSFKNNLKPIAKDNGVFLFIGIGRTDMELDIHVHEYESVKIRICFEDLDENMPVKEVYLLPRPNPAQKDSILTLRGNKPRIREIEAVSLSGYKISYKEYDVRKRILKVLNEHDVKLNDVYYGIIDTNQMEYEKIVVDKEITTKEVGLRNSLEKEHTINQPIVRIIFGQINDGGDYILKVPAGINSEYLVRYVVEDTVYFKKVNLADSMKVTL